MDQSHDTPPLAHFAGPVRREKSTTANPRARGFSAGALFAWLGLSAGTMLLTCGGVLVGWSSFTGREELWSIGLPLAIAGQLALVVGVLLHLDRLWSDNESHHRQLDRVDQRIERLGAAARDAEWPRESPDSNRRVDSAAGVSPHMLLADLKSQLDALAQKLEQSE